MNKNTTDITLSAYFNDIVIGYYEDEDLVKQFGRQLGFDVDMDTFMAVSFQYPSDMNVKPEDREKLTDAANAIIALSDINKKIGGKQIITCDSGVCVILIMNDKSAMRDLIPQVQNLMRLRSFRIMTNRYVSTVAAVALAFLLWNVTTFGITGSTGVPVARPTPTEPQPSFRQRVNSVVGGFYESLNNTFKNFTLTAESGLEQLKTEPIGGGTAKGE